MTACVAAVELGGTHALVSAGRGPGDMAAVRRLPTTTPGETTGGIVAALQTLRNEGWAFAAIGVASFGPVGVSPARDTYGRILSTPKPGWSGADLRGPLAALGGPVVFETDVNAAALGEGEQGAARGLSDFAYVTCGTGVGVGLCVGGSPVHGRLHPEGGHLRVGRLPGDQFPGVCPWHGDCVEGMICGPALAARTGADPATLPADDPVWDIAGAYLGQLLANVALLTSPQRIIVGGGVGSRPELLAAARRVLGACLAGYLDQEDAVDPERFVVPAALPHSGLVGALVLAARALASG
ncbi:MAG: ROK family protein [Caulobacteraceae bacterium]